MTNMGIFRLSNGQVRHYTIKDGLKSRFKVGYDRQVMLIVSGDNA